MMMIHPWSDPWSPQSDHIPLFMRSWDWQRPGQYSTLKSNITFAGIIEVIGWDIKPISPANCVQIYKFQTSIATHFAPILLDLFSASVTARNPLIDLIPSPCKNTRHLQSQLPVLQTSYLYIIGDMDHSAVLWTNISLRSQSNPCCGDVLFSRHMGRGDNIIWQY